jgi:molybdopterin-binding protein
MRCVSIAIGIVLMSGAIAPAAAGGQRLTERLIGSRVRIDTADGVLVTGTVVSVEADTVRLETGRASIALAVLRSRVISLEVSAGRDQARGAKRGALIGGGVGLAVMAL